MLRTIRRTAVLLAAGGGLLAAGPAFAQRTTPRTAPRVGDESPELASLFPPGVTIGGEARWTISGRNLATVERFLVSGEGVEVVGRESRPQGSVALTVRAAAGAEPGFRTLRAEGPGGLSNAKVFRVDPLPQVEESEPNDDPGHATPLAVGSAADAQLGDLDIDHFQLTARAGQRVTIEVEARRLGTAVEPVVTLLTRSGAALAQGRPGRGGDREVRLATTFAADGTYLLQVRDLVYSVQPGEAAYRVRVHQAPYATGLFPLGGPAGGSASVSASGGNLEHPRTRRVTLPALPGETAEPGAFEGAGGPVTVDARLVAGAGPEVSEASPQAPGRSRTTLPLNTTANGRIDAPAEVDEYIVAVKKGEKVRVKVQAADLGSWLDSVITLRDARGRLLAENDDRGGSGGARAAVVFGPTPSSPDSGLDYEAQSDGALYVEIADRYGEGGPEYAYRLWVGAAQPDFAIALLLGNPGNDRLRQAAAAGRGTGDVPANSGVLNLKPGSSTPVNFLIAAEGRTGPIVVRAEGLPQGVTAEPVTIRSPAPGPTAPRAGRAAPPAASGSLFLKVAPDAQPALGELRVLATAQPQSGEPLVRLASASLPIDATSASPLISRPSRQVTSIPVKVAGKPRPPLVGPPKPRAAP